MIENLQEILKEILKPDLLFNIIYPVVISYLFYLFQKNGVKTGKKFLKESKDGYFTKDEIYYWFYKRYKYFKVPNQSNNTLKIEITEKEYLSINEIEKIIEN